MNDSPARSRMRLAWLRENGSQYNYQAQAQVWDDWNMLTEHNRLLTELEAMEED